MIPSRRISKYSSQLFVPNKTRIKAVSIELTVCKNNVILKGSVPEGVALNKVSCLSTRIVLIHALQVKVVRLLALLGVLVKWVLSSSLKRNDLGILYPTDDKNKLFALYIYITRAERQELLQLQCL